MPGFTEMRHRMKTEMKERKEELKEKRHDIKADIKAKISGTDTTVDSSTSTQSGPPGQQSPPSQSESNASFDPLKIALGEMKDRGKRAVHKGKHKVTRFLKGQPDWGDREPPQLQKPRPVFGSLKVSGVEVTDLPASSRQGVYAVLKMIAPTGATVRRHETTPIRQEPFVWDALPTIDVGQREIDIVVEVYSRTDISNTLLGYTVFPMPFTSAHMTFQTDLVCVVERPTASGMMKSPRPDAEGSVSSSQLQWGHRVGSETGSFNGAREFSRVVGRLKMHIETSYDTIKEIRQCFQESCQPEPPSVPDKCKFRVLTDCAGRLGACLPALTWPLVKCMDWIFLTKPFESLAVWVVLCFLCWFDLLLPAFWLLIALGLGSGYAKRFDINMPFFNPAVKPAAAPPPAPQQPMQNYLTGLVYTASYYVDYMYSIFMWWDPTATMSIMMGVLAAFMFSLFVRGSTFCFFMCFFGLPIASFYLTFPLFLFRFYPGRLARFPLELVQPMLMKKRLRGGKVVDSGHDGAAALYHHHSASTTKLKPSAGKSKTKKQVDESLVTRLQTVLSIHPRPFQGMLEIRLIEAHNLRPSDDFSACDPFCVITTGGQTSYSSIVDNDASPVWDEELLPLKLFHLPTVATTRLWDYDEGKDPDFLGTAMWAVDGPSEEWQDLWLDLAPRDSHPSDGALFITGAVHLKFRVTELKMQ
eukprot:TRINITY_DN21006_c0_g1_i1.p1 TRINITY_DN21006_c0_g1~~TRINITY_DN21006_c0_g1_i1.p1  ORF type:complete len:698 (+),score=73.85 TRINITY_DN21006_c0_g1_i1:30-2123(+)